MKNISGHIVDKLERIQNDLATNTKTGGCVRKMAVCVAFIFLIVQRHAAQSLLQYVQPLSGTAPSTTTAAIKHSEAGSEKNANTIPAVTLPFAMTQWTPQTRTTGGIL